jgi:GNAT superfamily N-acetyltransferase
MTPAITITRLTQLDNIQMDELCRLRDALSAHHEDHSPSDRFRKWVVRHMGEETMLLFLLYSDAKAVGYGMAFDVEEHAYMPEWVRRGYITQFYVDASCRGQGVGEMGLNYIHNWFRSRGLKDAMLNVAIDNEVGNRFWVKQGYVPYATRMKYKLMDE